MGIIFTAPRKLEGKGFIRVCVSVRSMAAGSIPLDGGKLVTSTTTTAALINISTIATTNNFNNCITNNIK